MAQPSAARSAAFYAAIEQLKKIHPNGFFESDVVRAIEEGGYKEPYLGNRIRPYLQDPAQFQRDHSMYKVKYIPLKPSPPPQDPGKESNVNPNGQPPLGGVGTEPPKPQLFGDPANFPAEPQVSEEKRKRAGFCVTVYRRLHKHAPDYAPAWDNTADTLQYYLGLTDQELGGKANELSELCSHYAPRVPKDVAESVVKLRQYAAQAHLTPQQRGVLNLLEIDEPAKRARRISDLRLDEAQVLLTALRAAERASQTSPPTPKEPMADPVPTISPHPSRGANQPPASDPTPAPPPTFTQAELDAKVDKAKQEAKTEGEKEALQPYQARWREKFSTEFSLEQIDEVKTELDRLSTAVPKEEHDRLIEEANQRIPANIGDAWRTAFNETLTPDRIGAVNTRIVAAERWQRRWRWSPYALAVTLVTSLVLLGILIYPTASKGKTPDVPVKIPEPYMPTFK